MAGLRCEVRYARIEQLSIDFQTTPLAWLSPAEMHRWRQIRSTLRQRTLLAGRMLAKRLIQENSAAAQSSRPQEITIWSSTIDSQVGPPSVELAGARLDYALSISHTDDSVLVAGSNGAQLALGVDLVHRRLLGQAFERTWFTPAELGLVNSPQEDVTAADFWAIKEAVFKACVRDDPFEPRNVEIRGRHDQWTVALNGRDMSDCCALRTWRSRNEFAALAIYQSGGLEDVQVADHELKSALLLHD